MDSTGKLHTQVMVRGSKTPKANCKLYSGFVSILSHFVWHFQDRWRICGRCGQILSRLQSVVCVHSKFPIRVRPRHAPTASSDSILSRAVWNTKGKLLPVEGVTPASNSSTYFRTVTRSRRHHVQKISLSHTSLRNKLNGAICSSSRAKRSTGNDLHQKMQK